MMKKIAVFFWVVPLLMSAYVHAGLAQSKYDKEIELGLKRTTVYDKQFKFAKTQNPEAMKLYKAGNYLIDVLGSTDKKERMQEGIKRLQKALELDPTFAAAHISLGNAYQTRSIVWLRTDPLSPQERKVLIERARAEYRKAIEIDPDNPYAHFRLGFATPVDNLSERVRHLNKALELDPTLAVPEDDKAHIAEREGRVEEAFDYLIRRMARVPNVNRCPYVKNPFSQEYGFGYFKKKYPEKYQAFIERVCSGKDLPPYQRYGE